MINNFYNYKIKIKQININSDNLIIESNKGDIFITLIKKGSIKCKIFNESKQEVNLTYLNENSLVTITGSDIKLDINKSYNYLINDLEINNEEKNIIVINKICVKNNYVFNSDSSDSSDILEIIDSFN